MKRISTIAVLLCGGVVGAAERPAKPNVLLLLADDLGWQDVKCYDIDAPIEPSRDEIINQTIQFILTH